MKNIRQRKDDLLLVIKHKKQEPLVDISSGNIFDEYKKILVANGIRNEVLIETQLKRMIEAGHSKATIYSNLKFMNLFRSRLTEEGIPLDDAEKILAVVEFNMDEINEDDDYIGDVALEYAELCKIHYDFIKLNNKSLDDEKIVARFNLLPVQLPNAN